MTGNSGDSMTLGVRAVPAVKYAVGLAGIAAAVATARGLLPGVSLPAMLPLIVGTILAMAVLLIFAAAAVQANASSRNSVGIVFLWAVCIFVIVFMVFTITAVAIGQPQTWARLILPQEAAKSSALNELTRGSQPKPLESAVKPKPIAGKPTVRAPRPAKKRGNDGQSEARSATRYREYSGCEDTSLPGIILGDYGGVEESTFAAKPIFLTVRTPLGSENGEHYKAMLTKLRADLVALGIQPSLIEGQIVPVSDDDGACLLVAFG